MYNDAMKVLIIGATGLLGNALLRAWSAVPGCAAAGTYRSQPLPGLEPLELEDAAATRALITRVRPDVVAIPASNPNVDGCETDPAGTRKLNVDANLSAARAAAEAGARVICFSSDYVFDGARGGYVEADEPRPINDYGRQKLDLERGLAGLGDRALVLRVSALYGWELKPRNFVLQVLDRL